MHPHLRAHAFSSFAVMDALLRQLGGRDLLPNVSDVLTAGHSAGGQFVNRYAATNTVHQELEAAGVAVRYGCSAPSSCLYFGPERLSADGGFAVPDPAPEGYDDYGYGLRGLDAYPYVAAVGAEAIAEQYPGRRVTYLVGEEDNSADASTDRAPGAMLQGESRLERCTHYARHLAEHFGGALGGRQSAASVPGAAHSGSQVFPSDIGMRALFGP